MHLFLCCRWLHVPLSVEVVAISEDMTRYFPPSAAEVRDRKRL